VVWVRIMSRASEAKGKLGHIVHGFDQVDFPGGFAQGSVHLVVGPMADQDQVIAFPEKPVNFQVDFGHEGAGGVDDAQSASLRPGPHIGGDAVGRKNNQASFRRFVQMSMKTTPRALKSSTTERLWTISFRTNTGAEKRLSAMSTMSMARTTPAQKPRGRARKTFTD
jgi:hypothetical protein